jgi:hypothetical protein
VVIFTPAATFLKAKLRHKAIIAARRRDRKIDHRCADEYIQGLVMSKEYGAFIVDPDSVYTDKKSGIPILPVNAEIGITLNPRILRIIDGLKRAGIDNIEDAMKLNSIWGECTCGYEGPMKIVEVEDDGKTVMKLECPMNEIDVTPEHKPEQKDSSVEYTVEGDSNL